MYQTPLGLIYDCTEIGFWDPHSDLLLIFVLRQVSREETGSGPCPTAERRQYVKPILLDLFCGTKSMLLSSSIKLQVPK